MDDKNKVNASAISQLSELSEMAHLGRSSIVNVGPMMLIWGSAILIATFSEGLSEGSASTVVAWIAPIALAFILSLFAKEAARRDGRSVTWRSRAIYRVWVAAGAAIVIFNVGEELHHVGVQSESEAATALILSVAVMATAELSSRKALFYSGLGWIVTATVLFFVAQDHILIFLLGGGAGLLQILPGLYLLRDEWKA